MSDTDARRSTVDTSPHNAPGAALRDLPSVDALLRQPAIDTLLAEFARDEIVRCVRAVLDDRRAQIVAGRPVALDTGSLALDVRQRLHERRRPNLRPVINATGVVLHTGLGRAPLAEEAIEAIADVARGYSNLEYDLAAGRRGDRHAHVRELLCELTGAEDALVVNNNAAATMLALHALAAGRSVVVSRGQLVEIGGSFRMPDIMAAAGCRMVEVGTTNRTHLRDYEAAIADETAALVRVHTSNYRIRGFTAAPSTAELVELGRSLDRPLPVIDDLGSGMLIDRAALAGDAELAAVLARWDEPGVRQSVRAGAALVLFSGDKLLGGPQAGVIVGRREAIARLRRDPLIRTFRPDKLMLAGLEATLQLYRDPQRLAKRLPVLRLLTRGSEALRAAADALADSVRAHTPQWSVAVEPGDSPAGGGSLPDVPFETWLVRVSPAGMSAGTLAEALRTGDVPIICRVHDGDLLFDVRCLSDDDAKQIAAALHEAARAGAGDG